MDYNRLIRERRSVRHFSNESVDRSVIEDIIEQASWAPSAGNRQPWRVAALSPEKTKSIIEDYEALSWEFLYPMVYSIIDDNPYFEDFNSENKERLKRTLSLVKRKFFIAGSPWLLLVYSLRPKFRDTVYMFLTTIKFFFYRFIFIKGIFKKLSYLCYFFCNSCHAYCSNKKATESSLSNYMLALHLSATSQNLESCIQFSWSLVSRQLKASLKLERRAEILGAVIVGNKTNEKKDDLNNYTSSRETVPTLWR